MLHDPQEQCGVPQAVVVNPFPYGDLVNGYLARAPSRDRAGRAPSLNPRDKATPAVIDDVRETALAFAGALPTPTLRSANCEKGSAP